MSQETNTGLPEAVSGNGHPGPARTVFMVRHATPDWNRRDIRYDIPPGPDLTAKGREEAYQAGLYLKPYRIDVIYASPMARATQTAE
ncbi:MAG TPA: phosphoglycerate mutase family protein, partial [Ardenticatenaceae bacterium]|nr:phosphoglycerate mutase family protein [Ardenticatenaceae bacterium]